MKIDFTQTNHNTSDDKHKQKESSCLSHKSSKYLYDSDKKPSKKRCRKLLESHKEYSFPEDNFCKKRKGTDENALSSTLSNINKKSYKKLEYFIYKLTQNI